MARIVGPGLYEELIGGKTVQVERDWYETRGRRGQLEIRQGDWLHYVDGEKSARTWPTKREAFAAARTALEVK